MRFNCSSYIFSNVKVTAETLQHWKQLNQILEKHKPSTVFQKMRGYHGNTFIKWKINNFPRSSDSAQVFVIDQILQVEPAEVHMHQSAKSSRHSLKQKQCIDKYVKLKIAFKYKNCIGNKDKKQIPNPEKMLCKVNSEFLPRASVQASVH